MKSLKFARLAAIVAAVLVSSTAFAADTSSVTVSAQVKGVCKFSGTISTLNITSPTLTYLDPTLSTDGTGSTTVGYKCTVGYVPTFTVGGSTSGTYAGTGTSGLSNGAATPAYMDFSLSWTAPTAGGTGFSAAAQTITLNGKVLNSVYTAAAVGTYSQSVALAIDN